MKQGSFVLIRTYSAGVHYGELVERQGKEVTLKNARRIWSWYDALSCSEIAAKGVDLQRSKISIPVDGIILTEAIEIITISDSSNLPR